MKKRTPKKKLSGRREPRQLTRTLARAAATAGVVVTFEIAPGCFVVAVLPPEDAAIVDSGRDASTAQDVIRDILHPRDTATRDAVVADLARVDLLPAQERLAWGIVARWQERIRRDDAGEAIRVFGGVRSISHV